MSNKVVICGAGFIGSHIARAFALSNPQVQLTLASRNPSRLKNELSKTMSVDLTSASVDVTNISTLRPAFQNAHTVISLVGILQGSPSKFEAVQWKGAQNVALAAQEVGAKLIHLSAIGADPNSPLISPRTKGLGEQSVLSASPTATIIRPSLVFGPGDSFFARFATLSAFLPFMPVFGGGLSRFQPVFVGDIARLVELCSHTENPGVSKIVQGKILEAGGPDVFTYKQIMELVLKFTGRWRPIVSAPFWVGKLQGTIFEYLPENILSISRDQVSQLELDNVVSEEQSRVVPELLEKHGGGPRKSVHEILPTYDPKNKRSNDHTWPSPKAMPFTLRWGIMATGMIAGSFASDLLLEPSERGTDDVRHAIAAIASSSSEQKAKEFSHKIGVAGAKAYGSYEQLVEDAMVDIVYIATPQSRHYKDVLLALGAGKHVLCEKPFTINASQGAHLIEVAKSKNLFLMEAAWTRFLPHTKQVLKIIHEEKRIGKIRRVFADFSLLRVKNADSRLHDPALGGGALLDLGFHPITWENLVFSNHPDNAKAAPKVTAAVSLTPRGVDEFTNIALTYEKLGAVAYLTTSLSAKTPAPFSVRVQGEVGELLLSGTPPNPSGHTLQVEGEDPVEQEATRAGNNLIWQADACARAIRDGQLGCPESPLEDTLAILKIMDEVRRQGSFSFPSPLENIQQ